MKIHKNRSTLQLISIITAVLIAGSLLAYLKLREQPSQAKKTENISQNQASNDSLKTRQETSEGSTFDVPEGVPKDAIKNYTLITENEEFKIRREPGTNNYIITLYAIINNPSQYSMYQDQLREFKQHALKYLSDNGIDPKSISIIYEPEEATQL